MYVCLSFCLTICMWDIRSVRGNSSFGLNGLIEQSHENQSCLNSCLGAKSTCLITQDLQLKTVSPKIIYNL